MDIDTMFTTRNIAMTGAASKIMILGERNIGGRKPTIAKDIFDNYDLRRDLKKRRNEGMKQKKQKHTGKLIRRFRRQ